MMFRLSGNYPHADLLAEADDLRRRCDLSSRGRRRELDALEADQHRLKRVVVELARRILNEGEPDRSGEREAS